MRVCSQVALLLVRRDHFAVSRSIAIALGKIPESLDEHFCEALSRPTMLPRVLDCTRRTQLACENSSDGPCHLYHLLQRVFEMASDQNSRHRDAFIPLVEIIAKSRCEHL